jgi:hypothetical protein
MFDPETAALLRAVLNELCEKVPQLETSTRTRVASKILEAATKGEWSIDDLKEAGREALDDAPTMRR